MNMNGTSVTTSQAQAKKWQFPRQSGISAFSSCNQPLFAFTISIVLLYHKDLLEQQHN